MNYQFIVLCFALVSFSLTTTFASSDYDKKIVNKCAQELEALVGQKDELGMERPDHSDWKKCIAAKAKNVPNTSGHVNEYRGQQLFKKVNAKNTKLREQYCKNIKKEWEGFVGADDISNAQKRCKEYVKEGWMKYGGYDPDLRPEGYDTFASYFNGEPCKHHYYKMVNMVCIYVQDYYNHLQESELEMLTNYCKGYKKIEKDVGQFSGNYKGCEKNPSYAGITFQQVQNVIKSKENAICMENAHGTLLRYIEQYQYKNKPKSKFSNSISFIGRLNDLGAKVQTFGSNPSYLSNVDISNVTDPEKLKEIKSELEWLKKALKEIPKQFKKDKIAQNNCHKKNLEYLVAFANHGQNRDSMADANNGDLAPASDDDDADNSQTGQATQR